MGASSRCGAFRVTAPDGVVTLSGFVGSYAEKIAAENATRGVKGVRAIAQEIEVRLPSDQKRSDDEIARRMLDILLWASWEMKRAFCPSTMASQVPGYFMDPAVQPHDASHIWPWSFFPGTRPP